MLGESSPLITRAIPVEEARYSSVFGDIKESKRKASRWAIETWSLFRVRHFKGVGQPSSSSSKSLTEALKLGVFSLSLPVAIVSHFDNDSCFPHRH